METTSCKTVQSFIDAGYLKKERTLEKFSVFLFLDKFYVAFPNDEVVSPTKGILLSNFEHFLLSHFDLFDVLYQLKAKNEDVHFLSFDQKLFEDCRSFLGKRKIKSNIKQWYEKAKPHYKSKLNPITLKAEDFIPVLKSYYTAKNAVLPERNKILKRFTPFVLAEVFILSPALLMSILYSFFSIPAFLSASFILMGLAVLTLIAGILFSNGFTADNLHQSMQIMDLKIQQPELYKSKMEQRSFQNDAESLLQV